METDRLHPLAYFEQLYRSSPDPWGFESSWYERRKYALTTAALTRPRYRRGVEPGCSNGELTALLADRCDELWAFDFVPAVVERARTRCESFPGVRVSCASFPDWWPPGSGDLVVWSEVAYYLGEAAWADALAGLERWLEPGGEIVAVHYLGETDYPMRGDEVAERLDEVWFLERVVRHRDEKFELGVWRRN